MLTAVIVTYNRKELLSQNIEMLLKQTMTVDSIIIVDNCSSDGTYEYLKNCGWTTEPFLYLKTETNIGGAGGFYTGVKAAYEAGADWIVLMDDDGRMADEHTMEILYRAARKLYDENRGERKLFVNALVQKGELLSFKIDHMYTVVEAMMAAKNGLIEGAANPFNGTLISRELVSDIGYPKKEFFIKGDEVDYKQRALDAGAYVGTVTEAKYIHPRPETVEKTVLGVKVPFFVEAPWKEYYAARNFTYMYKLQEWYKGILFDGWKGNLGVKVKP